MVIFILTPDIPMRTLIILLALVIAIVIVVLLVFFKEDSQNFGNLFKLFKKQQKSSEHPHRIDTKYFKE
jgi:uncharacterized protein YxeA